MCVCVYTHISPLSGSGYKPRAKILESSRSGQGLGARVSGFQECGEVLFSIIKGHSRQSWKPENRSELYRNHPAAIYIQILKTWKSQRAIWEETWIQSCKRVNRSPPYCKNPESNPETLKIAASFVGKILNLILIIAPVYKGIIQQRSIPRSWQPEKSHIAPLRVSGSLDWIQDSSHIARCHFQFFRIGFRILPI